MYIENVTLKSVPADSLALPVEEGTILTKNGTIPADLSQAYGIVPQKITNIPPTKKINLAVAGTIDLKLNNVSFTEEEMQALGKDFNFVPGDEGGGNPNRVETVQGTLDWPFGMRGLSFANDLYTMNASAWLDLDCTILGLGIIRYPVISSDASTFTIFATSIHPESAFDSEAHWDYIDDGGINWFLDYALLLNATDGEYTITDMMDYKDFLPTTLTIIWHPLPDQS